MTAPSGQQALANARQVDIYDSGMCLQYVRGQAWRIDALYGSAIDAWHGALHRHPGDRNPPVGAPMFYSGGTWGHIVVATADRMRSTDCTSSGRVSEAAIDWPVNNWGQTYLGWTEDLNGIDLPLGGEDEMTPDDWDKLRGIVRDEVWERKLEVDKPDGSQTKKAAGQMLREILQRVQK
jgi:hypothetical protein